MLVETISQKISQELNPIHFEIYNDSHLHSRNPSGETHIRVLVVTLAFEGLSRVERSQKLDQIIAEERSLGLHSFSQKCYTPSEWEKLKPTSEATLCMSANKPKS
jgi:stress-induced morphogen